MVDACSASADAACCRTQQRHLQAFIRRHPKLQITSNAICHASFSDFVSDTSDSESSHAPILRFFLCLDGAQSLVFLLLLARNSGYNARLQPMLKALPGWAARMLADRFETYDALREQATKEEQEQLPADFEEYIGEVFAACEDARSVKMSMLHKSQQFARDNSRDIAGQLDEDEYSEGDCSVESDLRRCSKDGVSAKRNRFSQQE